MGHTYWLLLSSLFNIGILLLFYYLLATTIRRRTLPDKSRKHHPNSEVAPQIGSRVLYYLYYKYYIILYCYTNRTCSIADPNMLNSEYDIITVLPKYHIVIIILFFGKYLLTETIRGVISISQFP